MRFFFLRSLSALYILWYLTFGVMHKPSHQQSALSIQPSSNIEQLPISYESSRELTNEKGSKLLGNCSRLDEQHRPQFHFTPPKKWMNDPNGMFYFKGEYHLFYQYFPDSTVWGPMHWGHAVSKDMLHWEHLPIALYPDKNGLIFSGSVVIDKNNTSGFGKKGETPLVAIFTNHSMELEKAGKNDFQTQSIAFSVDKGRTWTKYADNPVIKNPNLRDFRDPKVIWYEPNKLWVMTLAVKDHVEFYTSKNLKAWQKSGEFGKNDGSHGGVWECPDLFPIAINNQQSAISSQQSAVSYQPTRRLIADSSKLTTQKWVLLQSIGNGSPNGGSGTQYFIGEFDGKTFKNDNSPETILWLDYGRDNYAGVTWFGAPNNRRLFLGWMSNWQYATKVPTDSWRSAMTLPRELILKNTKDGIRLFQKPIVEEEKLRGNFQMIEKKLIVDSCLIKTFGELSKFPERKKICHELDLTFDLSKTTSDDLGFELSNALGEKVRIGFEKKTNRYYIDRSQSGKKDFEQSFAGKHYAPRSSSDSKLKMHLFIDVASVELFADEGVLAMTDVFFPNEDFNKISVYSKNGNTQILSGKIWELK